VYATAPRRAALLLLLLRLLLLLPLLQGVGEGLVGQRGDRPRQVVTPLLQGCNVNRGPDAPHCCW